jgi:Radical SAM superfamily/Phosphotransferase enzyme family/Iron-sulfur cluster-binding domain
MSKNIIIRSMRTVSLPIRFNELYLELSNVCNAECAHCYVSSGPQAARDRLTPQTCRELIAAAAASDIVAPRVILAGGEPTLRWDEMMEILQAAHNYSMTSGIITNGWWGRTRQISRRRAGELATVGIGHVEISLSAYHRQFVSNAHVQNVLDALADNGIDMVLQVRYDTEHSAVRLLDQFDRPQKSRVIALPISGVGRGATLAPLLIPRLEIEQRPEGSCAHDLSLTVNPIGNVYPCCCGAENTTGLRLGNIYETPISQIIEQLGKRPAIGCLATLGPAELLRMIAAKGYPVPETAGHATICELCVDLFNRPSVVAAVDEVTTDPAAVGRVARSGADVPTDAELLAEAWSDGVAQPSGARVLRRGHQVIKVGTGMTAIRLNQQVDWLKRVRAAGVTCVPEVVAVYDEDGKYGYAMRAYNMLAVPPPPRVPALARLLLDHLESIWRLPTASAPPSDLAGYTDKVASILAGYDAELAARFRTAGAASWAGLEVPRPCLVHGDATFENLAVDPMGGLMVLDPLPQQAPALSIPELDAAKVLQSAAGWEAFVRRRSTMLRVPIELRPLITDRFGAQRWSAVLWLTVSHLARTLFYGAKVGNAAALLPSIRLLLDDLPGNP